MTDDIVARLRDIEESTYGVGFGLTQIRKLAKAAADRIEKLERRESAVKSAIEAIPKEEEQ